MGGSPDAPWSTTEESSLPGRPGADRWFRTCRGAGSRSDAAPRPPRRRMWARRKATAESCVTSLGRVVDTGFGSPPDPIRVMGLRRRAHDGEADLSFLRAVRECALKLAFHVEERVGHLVGGKTFDREERLLVHGELRRLQCAEFRRRGRACGTRTAQGADAHAVFLANRTRRKQRTLETVAGNMITDGARYAQRCCVSPHRKVAGCVG